MAWQRLTFVTLIAGALLTGCAGAEHQLPEITQAESYSAAQTITAAPSLAPTTRTRSENERMARKVLGKLQGVASLICEATEQNKCWYTLELSPDGEMNAYVLKNQIVIHNGLAQYLQTEDEFAVVIAHEMGHHIAHHYDKGSQNRASGAAIAGLIFLGIATATNAYQYNPNQQQTDMQNIMKLGASVGGMSFSKEHEREADYVAAYLLARAGYDPEAGNDVWIKLAKASGKMKTQLFDTHPAGPDRLAGWQRAVNEVRYSSDLMPNFADAEYEPRLQQARVFGASETNIQEGKNEPAESRGIATWHTFNDRVLAYSEYGGEGDTLRIPKQVDLYLVLQRGEWGIFEYAAEGGGVGQGWVLMENVKRY